MERAAGLPPDDSKKVHEMEGNPQSQSVQVSDRWSLDDLLGPSIDPAIICFDEGPLDRPIAFTHFPDRRAGKKSQHRKSLRSLVGIIQRKKAAAKGDLPWLKLATFGDQRTDKNCLRHTANVKTISGIEADYDAQQVTPEQAAATLRQAGIAALIYTSASHTPAAPRWRVLAPLSHDHAPSDRESLCARLNGALGGILQGESFTLAQSYYYGSVADQHPVETLLIDGEYLDHVQGIVPLGKGGVPYKQRPQVDPYNVDDLLAPALPEVEWQEVRRALYAIPPEIEYPEWRRVAKALHHASGGSDELRQLFGDWSRTADYSDAPKRKPLTDRNLDTVWAGCASEGTAQAITIGTLFHIASAHGYQRPRLEVTADDFDDIPAEPAAQKPSRLSFLSPSECKAAPSRGYLVKGLFAPGDVGCIFGAPGAGKSLLSPFLGYAVAQGREAFGMRTRVGKVFYVAAEDPTGMRGRIMALEAAHGDAPDFRLVEGVSDLLTHESPDLAALIEAVKQERPALIFIDTLAMSFPGLEENDAKGMGRVVSVARRLAKWGAAVILIHHDTKAEGATPRGHSLLNGALDVALHVKRDESGIIRGKLTKNRNGACDRDIAFRIATEDGGIDEDGDVISLPRCAVVIGGPSHKLNLPTGQAAAAMVVLQRLQDEGGGARVRKAEWRKACAASDAVCGKDDPETRKKAFYRALETLSRGGHIRSAEGWVWIDDGFDTAMTSDGQGHFRDMSLHVPRNNGSRVRDGQGHTP